MDETEAIIDEDADSAASAATMLITTRATELFEATAAAGKKACHMSVRVTEPEEIIGERT